MDKKEKIILLVALLFTFIMVYSPHFNYPFPFHVDEWHHIDEAKRLFGEEKYVPGENRLEFGFHLFLGILPKVVNLVLVYKFLPAVWMVLSALALFFLVYKKTNHFETAIFSILFFASIKSNTNLLGPWFFTPLTFATPLIFLYIYFFTEGYERTNKKYL